MLARLAEPPSAIQAPVHRLLKPQLNLQRLPQFAQRRRRSWRNIPNGIVPASPGLRVRELPWVRLAKRATTPTGLRQYRLFHRIMPQPFLGCIHCLLIPRVARSSQPWAWCRNPFGILFRFGRREIHVRSRRPYHDRLPHTVYAFTNCFRSASPASVIGSLTEDSPGYAAHVSCVARHL
jgi:hypothetical protein